MKESVLVIGSTTRDIFLKAAAFKDGRIPFGEKTTVEEFAVATGGGASNIAVGLARLGVRTACLTRVGADEAGHAAAEEFTRENVNLDFMQTDDKIATAHSVILVNVSGERAIFQYRGANNRLAVNLDRLPTEVFGWLYAADTLGERDESNLKNILIAAQKTGAALVLTPDNRMLEKKEILTEVLLSTDLLFVNESEAAKILSREKLTGEAAVRALAERVKGVAVVTAGPKGSWAARREAPARVYFVAAPPGEIVDRTGAGDAYAAAFLADYIRDGDVKRSMEAGTKNATAVVAHFGGKEGLLEALQVEEL